MRAKRFFVINVVFLLINITILLSIILLVPGSPYYFDQSANFHPIKTQAPSFTFVGQLRFPKNLEHQIEYLDKDVADLEFCGIDRAASSEGYDIVKVKQTLKSSVGGHSNFVVLRFCPEDDFWYIIFYPNHMEGKGPSESPGTCVVNYSVPPGVIEDSGTYAIGIKEKGYCKFEIE